MNVYRDYCTWHDNYNIKNSNYISLPLVPLSQSRYKVLPWGNTVKNIIQIKQFNIHSLHVRMNIADCIYCTGLLTRQEYNEVVKRLFSNNEILDYFRYNFCVLCIWSVVMAESKCTAQTNSTKRLCSLIVIRVYYWRWYCDCNLFVLYY